MPQPNKTDIHRWDCWTIKEEGTSTFHVFRLSTLKEYFNRGEHHLHARLAHGTSTDLINIAYDSDDILAIDRNSSVWSGCTIQAPDGSYQIFFTERSENEDTWAQQQIRRATSPNLSPDSWHVDPDFCLKLSDYSDQKGKFSSVAPANARSIHAWRDPFVFSKAGKYFMLVAAKLESNNPNTAACIALLRASDQSLSHWSLVNPALVSGFEELEVPQAYYDSDSRSLVLLASTWREDDYQESFRRGASPACSSDPNVVRRNGRLIGFSANSFDDFTKGKFTEPQVFIDETVRLYAAHIIPELNGAAVGFNVDTGEHKVIAQLFPSFERIS